MEITEERVYGQDVAVPDVLVRGLADREYAQGLLREVGVRLHFGISWAVMPYCIHYRSPKLGAEVWRFSNKSFVERGIRDGNN